MYHIRLASPTEGTSRVLQILGESSGAVNVTVLPGSARFPDGDMVECDLTPDVADQVIHQLRELGPRRRGPISVDRSRGMDPEAKTECSTPSITTLKAASMMPRFG